MRGKIVPESKGQGHRCSPVIYEVTADDFAKLEAGETVSITLPDANVSLRLLYFGKVDEIPKISIRNG